MIEPNFVIIFLWCALIFGGYGAYEIIKDIVQKNRHK